VTQLTTLAETALAVGRVIETTFEPNPIGGRFRWRATRVGGRRAPKLVLSNDARIVPGVACQVRVTEVRKPGRRDHGYVAAEFLRATARPLDGIWMEPSFARKFQVALECGMHVLLEGPQGCGKTVMTRAMARALGFEYVYFNCSAVRDSSEFMASLQVIAGPSGQSITTFLKSAPLLAIEAAAADPSRRYVLFLDELNRSGEEARNVLTSALDSTRRIFNPIRNADELIPANLQVVAAVNRGREFSGTYAIDAAQHDRFCTLSVWYPPAEEEMKLLQAWHPELSRKLVARVVTIANSIRNCPTVTAGLSVRATDEACRFLGHPIFHDVQHQELADVLKTSFCGRFAGAWDDVGSDRGQVWLLVEKGVAG
jgi:MoxR-like ATPase